MFPPVLLLAAAADAENLSAFTKLTSQFGIDLPLLLAQMLCFTIVAILLWKLAFIPVLATLEERQQQIGAGLKYAEEMKAKLAQAHEDSAALIKQARLEGAKIIDETRQTAKAFLDQQQKEAVARANDLISKAQQAIELEHKKMLDEARVEVARLVVATTQRVLTRELSDTERGRFNEAAAREISTVT